MNPSEQRIDVTIGKPAEMHEHKGSPVVSVMFPLDGEIVSFVLTEVRMRARAGGA